MSGIEEQRRLWETGLPGRLPQTSVGPDFWVQACGAVADQQLSLPAEDPEPEARGLRVWLLIHRTGGEQTGAIAGLALTSALVAAGRRTVLVDADDAESLLSRRSGRLFRPGWLDMARYGTSLTTAAVEVDWSGQKGYFLPLGSYCPAEATPGEIGELIFRLQERTDEMVVVCGQGAEMEPWAAVAHRVMYCWDRQADARVVLDAALDDLTRRGYSCPVVLVFGDEPAPQVEPPVAPSEPVAMPAGVSTAADHQDLEPAAPAAAAPLVAPLAAPRQEVHSSGIFRVVAMAGLVAVILLVVFLWKFTGLSRGPGADRLTPRGSQSIPAVVAVPDSADRGTGERTDSMMNTGGDSSLTPGAVTDIIAGGDSTVATDTAPATDLVDSTVQGTPGLTPPEEETPDLRRQWAMVAPAFSGPVGTLGWCLHVYSLPDSVSARREIGLVADRGVSAVMAPVVLPNSTRWFRIYMGNFATRAEALRAEPALKWKLRTDWANPTRRPDSARD